MNRWLTCLLALSTVVATAPAQNWICAGGNSQHTGIFTGISQSASKVHWQAPLDDNRSYYGEDVLAHFASPVITAANTVVYSYRYTLNGSGSNQYDNWRVTARSGGTGAVVWTLATDYSTPQIWPNGWTSIFPLTLCPVGATSGAMGVAAAGSGGSIFIRSSADTTSSTVKRFAFYTTPADFTANQAAYSVIKINTPLTTDKAGNIYFGYEVTGTLPSNLSALGTGGIAKVNSVTGVSSYKSVQTLAVDGSLSRPARSAAPALSNDEKSVYVALTGGSGFLAKLNTSNLVPTAQTRLIDPSISNANAYLINESSASPMVGPDGHVFMGVFGNQWRESHGWMLQFDGNLNPNDANGRKFPTGAFGWDDTATVVPASCVPSYKGAASYLILTKYNNYDFGGSGPGADGSNKLAVIDPTSDSTSLDRISGIHVMNEVLTVLGPVKINNNPGHPDARHEWCINTAAIDVNGKSAIVNSEDGRMYRWSFVTNTCSETLMLQPPTGEAYTSTAIGPDGQLYAMNNCILFAIGSVGATKVSVYQGSAGKGSLPDIWYQDGASYSTVSVPTTAGPVAAIEADFTVTNTKPTSLSLSAVVSAASGVSGQLYAYNYSTGQFVLLMTQSLSSAKTTLSSVVSVNPSQYIAANGTVRLLVRGVSPSRLVPPPFTLGLDLATCTPK